MDEVHTSKDGIIRSVTVRYQNANEATCRTTNRAVRSLIIIHGVDEIDLMEELGEAAIRVDTYHCHQLHCAQ